MDSSIREVCAASIFGMVCVAPSIALGGATLLTDVRKVDAFATGGTTTEHQTFQATFGQNSFSSAANASSYLPGPSPPGGFVSAHASLSAQFVMGINGFQELSGATNSDNSVLLRPDQFAGVGSAQSVVDETFHIDQPQTYQLSGQNLGANITLQHVGGANVFSAPNVGSFGSTGVLPAGDYRFVSNLNTVLSSGFGGGSFQFDLALFDRPVIPSNAYIGTIFGGTGVPGGGTSVTLTIAQSDFDFLPIPPFLFDKLQLTRADSGRTFTKTATDPGFQDFAALLTNGVRDHFIIDIFGGGSSGATEQSLFTSCTGAPFPFVTDFHGLQIQSISLVVNNVFTNPATQETTLDALLAVQIVPEPSTIALAALGGSVLLAIHARGLKLPTMLRRLMTSRGESTPLNI